jgi:Gas vesicle protein
MPTPSALHGSPTRTSSGLVDILDRVLDKGLVIAGDVKISVAEVELLTIRIRLLICSIDKAQEVGLDWWKHDRHLSVGGQQRLALENQELRQQIAALERRLARAEMPGVRRSRGRRP